MNELRKKAKVRPRWLERLRSEREWKRFMGPTAAEYARILAGESDQMLAQGELVKVYKPDGTSFFTWDRKVKV